MWCLLPCLNGEFVTNDFNDCVIKGVMNESKDRNLFARLYLFLLFSSFLSSLPLLLFVSYEVTLLCNNLVLSLNSWRMAWWCVGMRWMSISPRCPIGLLVTIPSSRSLNGFALQYNNIQNLLSSCAKATWNPLTYFVAT